MNRISFNLVACLYFIAMGLSWSSAPHCIVLVLDHFVLAICLYWMKQSGILHTKCGVCL